MNTVPRQQLRPDFDTPRIIKGNWQLADDHSTAINDAELYENMAPFVDAGITAFDCGDIYYGVEEWIGRFIAKFRTERGVAEAEKIAVHTKYIPAFLEPEKLANQTRAVVEEVIDRSLTRLQVERLDLVQLHWWNYDIEGVAETALILEDLKKAGKIHHIGATNFNVPELKKIVDAGADIVIHQVQYSPLDNRPKNGMSDFCKANDIHLACYGAMAGGLLSEKWKGIRDPGEPAFENVSLDKYYRIALDFGGWDLMQELVSVLEDIGRKHDLSIPVVASRYVLEQEAVAAVIQGSRHARHLEQNLKLFSFELDDEDKAALENVISRSTGPKGDCYDLDRIEDRDAIEDLSADYFDVEDGKLVKRKREIAALDSPYGHHLLTQKN